MNINVEWTQDGSYVLIKKEEWIPFIELLKKIADVTEITKENQ